MQNQQSSSANSVSGAYYSPMMDFYSNDVSRTSDEERTASVTSLDSHNQPRHNQENEQLARKLKQIAEFESKYKPVPLKRKPENILRAKRFLKWAETSPVEETIYENHYN